MLTSVIVSVLVLVAAIFMAGLRPPWALQPATVASATGGASRKRSTPGFAASVPLHDDDEPSILIDSLRVLGLVRRRVDRPTVGRRAYVRLWERIRAMIVLTTIIVTIGVLLAAAIGITVVTAGFLLERAIS